MGIPFIGREVSVSADGGVLARERSVGASAVELVLALGGLM